MQNGIDQDSGKILKSQQVEREGSRSATGKINLQTTGKMPVLTSGKGNSPLSYISKR